MRRELRRDPLELLERIASRGGDAGEFRVGRQRVVLINRPEAVREVLVTRNRSFVKQNVIDSSGRNPEEAGSGLLLLDDDPDSRAGGRRLVHPAFTQERLDACVPGIAETVEQAIDGWRDGDQVAIGETAAAVSMLVGANVILGADVRTELAELTEATDALMEPFALATSPASSFVLGLRPAGRRSLRGYARLQALISAQVHEERPAGSKDAVSLALAGARDLLGPEVQDADLEPDLLRIFLAGVETTAAALAWAWLLLAAHLAAATRLEAEVDALASAPELRSLPYARMIFAETLRLYPPSWYIGRRALREEQIGADVIPKGTVVLVSPYLLHRDSRCFADPLEFKPERWEEPSPKRPGSLCYFPFGAGPRQCLGERLAWAEGVVALATVARRFRLHPESAALPAAEAAASLRPAGRPTVRVELRRATAAGAPERAGTPP